MTQRNNNPGRILKGTAIQPTLKSASGVWTINEALQAHRNNSWPQPNLFQPISNSLRFKGNSPASYLIKQNARPGSTTTGTISFWTKLGYNSNDQHFFQTVDALNGSSGANRLYMAFTAGTGTMYIYGQDGTGSQDIYFVTTQSFRDFSAWYHIVIAIDSTQTTQANRFKLYVNGVQITSFSTASYPAQSAVIAFSNNATTFVGCNRSSSLAYSGEMSEYYFVDGYALQPTMFGQFDSNNVWVPIPYTGSYGTNGFYLPFTNAQTSQTLGYDASLNGTPTYTADQDPYRGSVTLHLDGNGPAGGQNNIFLDSSPSNLAITRQGTPTQGSFSPFPLPTNTPYNPTVSGGSIFTSASLNANNYLTTSATSTLEFGSGNFTIELWWYPMSTTRQALYHGSIGADWSVGIDFNGTGVQSIGIWASSNGTSWNLLSGDPSGNGVGSVIITQNSWNHIVYQRNGTTWQSFINGRLDRNVTSLSGTVSTRSTYGKNIGSWWNTTAMSTATGYISSFRIITGQAVYAGSSGFTPMVKPFGTLTNNLLPFSEDFVNSFWSPYNLTVAPGAGIAPDGTSTATLVTSTQIFANSNIAFSYSSTSNSLPYTFSIYAKAGTLYSFRHRVAFTGGTVGLGISIDVNLQTGTIQSAESGYSNASITPVGNGWYRISITASNNGTGNTNYIGQCYLGSLQGTSTGSIYIWGAQYEQSNSVGNYTPTPANFSTAPALLLNFANAAIVDSAGGNNVITVNSATISPVSKYGSGALSFNGVTDYLLVPANPTMAFGTGAFTIEFWHFSPTIGSNTCLIDMQNGLMIRQNSNNSLLTYSRASSTQLVVTSNNTLMPNVWSHVAVTRLGTTMTVWINGQNQGQWSLNDSLTQTANTYIGAFINNQVSPQTFTGQLDDLRITAGVARYQANFAPPVRALPAIGGKSFVTQNINAGVVKSFTTVGTTSWTAPSDVAQVELLVVAGGGGGGQYAGGGGGAGGLIYNNQYPVTPGQTYTVTVGAGGAGAPGNSTAGSTRGTSGNNSQFGNLTAIGGGGGGVYSTSGNTGGSGGGGGGGSSGTYAGGSGTAGQGFAGGYGIAGGSENGGGGGGAGAVGTNATAPNTNGYAGGNGLQFGISGTPTYYAGGGGGGSVGSSYTAGAGGLGGGGNGISYQNQPVTANIGVANTGGGGGGGGYVGAYPGAAGGSGIVIVRYTTTAVANTSDRTTDTLTDSPTLYGHDFGNGGEVVGNYCTWNGVDSSTKYINSGGLSNTAGGGNYGIRGTIAVSSGLWYWEFSVDQTSSTNHHGVWSVAELPGTNYIGQTAGSWGMYDSNGNKRNNGSFVAYGTGFNNGDIGMVALDMNNGYIYWGKNGAWFNNGNPATLANPAFTNLSGYTVAPATQQYSAASYNFGQRPWAFTPPAGFLALTTKNLQRLTIGSAAATPNQFFDIVLYTGNASTQNITGLNFQPDMVWLKDRTSATSNFEIQDSVRGASNILYPNTTGVEVNATNTITSFNSNGFSIGSSNEINANGDNIVAWCWKAGGTAVSNTAGTITSQVSANTTSGFSIVTYTGTGTAGATIGHGLNAVPNVIIVKSRINAGHWWIVGHSGLNGGSNPWNYYLQLQNNSAANSGAGAWNNTAPTTSVFSVGTGSDLNVSGQTQVAYCWTQIPGFSQFGTYTGNGSTDGPFIYCGFKPRWIMTKRTDSTGDWLICDTARNPSNPLGEYLMVDSTSAGTSGYVLYDILSNGFKLRITTDPNINTSTIIYMAFADKPFGNTNGTAR